MEHQLLRSFIFLAGLASPIFLFARVGIHYKKKTQGNDPSYKREIILFLFFISIIFIASFTLVPVPNSRYPWGGIYQLNLIPLKNTLLTIREAQIQSHNPYSKDGYENFIGNILMFIPLGILLPLLYKKFKSFRRLLLFSFLISLSIEVIQYLSNYIQIYRSCDIDDIIFNVTGAAIGYSIYLIYASLQRR